MGAQPRLKIKTELNYRKGSTNESENCRYCVNFIPEFPICGTDGMILRVESRCRVFGKKEGRSYRVRPDYRCDAQKFNGTDFSKGTI